MSIEDLLAKLSLNKYQEVFSQQNGNHDFSKYFVEISKWSNTTEGLSVLNNYYYSDPIAFLNGVRSLHDSNGTILLCLINVAASDKKQTLDSVLVNIKRILKEDSEKEFFLKVYYILISEFNTCVPLHLPSILTNIDNDELSPWYLWFCLSA